jgi:TetR/AcrR family transcriptional repressor of mexJK operon
MTGPTEVAPGEETASPPAPRTRSDRKRQAVLDTATRLFLQQGYQGTSMDEIASAAEVSKQTVYKQFTDKRQLFTEIILGITGRAERIGEMIDALFADIVDLERGLANLARIFVAAVLDPQVLQLRRLVISEADRFPDLARAYFERAPGRGLAAIAAGLEELTARNMLRIDDVTSAAAHFAYLVLGPGLDRALFYPYEQVSDADVDRCATTGVAVFLAAYSTS